jgi:hypothetical protein
VEPEYYNKEVGKWKLTVRNTYTRRKFRQQYREELKQLSEQLILAEKCTLDIFKVCTKNEGKCWTEFYKYVKRRKGNRENISAIKDGSGRLITDSIEKGNFLNFCYSLVFSCERSVPQMQLT